MGDAASLEIGDGRRELGLQLARLEGRLGPRGYCWFCALVAFVALQWVASANGVVELLVTGKVVVSTWGNTGRLYGLFVPLAADPFLASDLGLPQLRLRILGPLVAWVFGVRSAWGALWMWGAGLVALYVVARLARGMFTEGEAREERAWTALLLPVVIGTAHPFVIGNSWLGYQDSVAGLAVLLAMRYRAWWATGAALGVGMLADERVLGVAPVVVWWHWMRDGEAERLWLGRLRVLGCAVALGLWCVYVWWMLGRLGLTPAQFLAPGLVRTDLMFRRIPLHVFLALRAGWLAVGAAGLAAVLTVLEGQRGGWKRVGTCVGVMLVLLPLVGVACKVGDVSRVVGYGFAVVVWGTGALRLWRPRWVVGCLAGAAGVNLLMPLATGIGSNTYPIPGALMSLVAYVLGIKSGL